MIKMKPIGYIGQVIKDDQKDLIIINQEARLEKARKRNKRLTEIIYNKLKCNKCGWDGKWIKDRDLFNKQYNYRCACCNDKVTVKGINDVATTNPELIKFFYNPEEACTITAGSNKKIKAKCPECGDNRLYVMKWIKRCGYYPCPKCGDGFSIPEKFVYAILQESKIDFIYHANSLYFPWCKNYIYDFYIPYKNMIVEVNGIQHYEDNHFYNKGLEGIKQIDTNKILLARDNGISCYGFIPLTKTNYNDLVKDIYESEVIEALGIDLNKIDLKKCFEKCLTSKVKEVCDYYNNHPDLMPREIGEIFHLCKATILKYLNRGTLYGWCNYSIEVKEKHKRKEGIKSPHCSPIEVFKDGNSLGIFESITNLERESEKLFGVKLLAATIYSINKSKLYKGFTFKRLMKGEYYDRSKNIS